MFFKRMAMIAPFEAHHVANHFFLIIAILTPFYCPARTVSLTSVLFNNNDGLILCTEGDQRNGRDQDSTIQCGVRRTTLSGCLAIKRSPLHLRDALNGWDTIVRLLSYEIHYLT
jgi:hypothetical protein